MLRVILVSFLVLSALSPQAFSQQAPAKVLMVVHSSQEDVFGFGVALVRALELKKGGVNVQVVFEGESVLYFLGKEFVNADLNPNTPPGPARPRGDAVDGSSVPAVTSSASAAAPGSPEEAAPGKGPGQQARKASFRYVPDEKYNLLGIMAEFEAAKIPYTLCSFSAKFLGKYDQLNKMGRPMSKDATWPAPLSPYVKEGYQIIGY